MVGDRKRRKVGRGKVVERGRWKERNKKGDKGEEIEIFCEGKMKEVRKG